MVQPAAQVRRPRLARPGGRKVGTGEWRVVAETSSSPSTPTAATRGLPRTERPVVDALTAPSRPMAFNQFIGSTASELTLPTAARASNAALSGKIRRSHEASRIAQLTIDKMEVERAYLRRRRYGWSSPGSNVQLEIQGFVA
jgi:hypothetical protein